MSLSINTSNKPQTDNELGTREGFTCGFITAWFFGMIFGHAIIFKLDGGDTNLAPFFLGLTVTAALIGKFVYPFFRKNKSYPIEDGSNKSRELLRGWDDTLWIGAAVASGLYAITHALFGQVSGLGWVACGLIPLFLVIYYNARNYNRKIEFTTRDKNGEVLRSGDYVSLPRHHRIYQIREVLKKGAVNFSDRNLATILNADCMTKFKGTPEIWQTDPGTAIDAYGNTVKAGDELTLHGDVLSHRIVINEVLNNGNIKYTPYNNNTGSMLNPNGLKILGYVKAKPSDTLKNLKEACDYDGRPHSVRKNPCNEIFLDPDASDRPIFTSKQTITIDSLPENTNKPKIYFADFVGNEIQEGDMVFGNMEFWRVDLITEFLRVDLITKGSLEDENGTTIILSSVTPSNITNKKKSKAISQSEFIKWKYKKCSVDRKDAVDSWKYDEHTGTGPLARMASLEAAAIKTIEAENKKYEEKKDVLEYRDEWMGVYKSKPRIFDHQGQIVLVGDIMINQNTSVEVKVEKIHYDSVTVSNVGGADPGRYWRLWKTSENGENYRHWVKAGVGNKDNPATEEVQEYINQLKAIKNPNANGDIYLEAGKPVKIKPFTSQSGAIMDCLGNRVHVGNFVVHTDGSKGRVIKINPYANMEIELLNDEYEPTQEKESMSTDAFNKTPWVLHIRNPELHTWDKDGNIVRQGDAVVSSISGAEAIVTEITQGFNATISLTSYSGLIAICSIRDSGNARKHPLFTKSSWTRVFNKPHTHADYDKAIDSKGTRVYEGDSLVNAAGDLSQVVRISYLPGDHHASIDIDETNRNGSKQTFTLYHPSEKGTDVESFDFSRSPWTRFAAYFHGTQLKNGAILEKDGELYCVEEVRYDARVRKHIVVLKRLFDDVTLEFYLEEMSQLGFRFEVKEEPVNRAKFVPKDVNGVELKVGDNLYDAADQYSQLDLYTLESIDDNSCNISDPFGKIGIYGNGDISGANLKKVYGVCDEDNVPF